MRALLVCVLLAGCLEKQELRPCGDDFCVGNTTCVNDRCVTADELAACMGLAEGDPCVVDGATGRCESSVCVSAGCGNSVIDTGEVCDDGNVISGDGCRADCQKAELCGDAVLDVGEGCDDGNTNPADGCDACVPTEWIASAIVGSNPSGPVYPMFFPNDVAVDRDGVAYIADTSDARVWRLHPNGSISIAAGTGEPGFSGDGGLAINARLSGPQGVGLDSVGNLYIADSSNGRVRKVDRQGVITTIAGGATQGVGGDGGLATAAQLNLPTGVAVDAFGNIFIAEPNAARIRKVDTAGIISTYAGTVSTPGYGGDDGLATSALLNAPRGIALDADGNLYIADTTNHRIRKVDTAGTITTFAGIGGTAGFSGEGGQAVAAQLSSPTNVAVDVMGRVYIADRGNQRIRRVSTTGVITTVAGSTTFGFAGDGGPATAALLRNPAGIAVDLVGNLTIADSSNNRIRRVSAAGTISTVAGTGDKGFTGNASLAVSVPLLASPSVTVDASGAFYFVEQITNRIRKVDASGVITTIAGTSETGATGDGGPATAATFNGPTAILRAGTDLYVADSGNHVIRKIDAAGVITRVAGQYGVTGSADNADALLGSLNGMVALAFKAGELYIADDSTHKIRKLTAAGALTTIAGTTSGYSGDNNPATGAQLNTPRGLAFDGSGNLLISDSSNHCIRKIDGGGTITTIVGTCTSVGFSGDGNAATSAQLRFPRGIGVAPSGEIYIADTGNRRVRKVAAGTISTVAGDGTIGFAGDGGPAANAVFDTMLGVTVDATGRVYIADTQSGVAAVRVIRRIETDGTISTVAGLVDPIGAGPLATGSLAGPVAIARDAAFTIFAGGARGIVQVLRPGATSIETVAGRYPQSVPTTYAVPTPATGNLARFRGVGFGTVDGLAYEASTKRIFISQASTNSIHVITVVDPTNARTWTIAPLANAAGTAGHADGPLTSATFKGPTGLHLAGSTLYVADTGNHLVRAIDLSASQVTTLAGTAQVRGYFGDGVVATTALLQDPSAITTCPNGDVFIADTGNHRVRRVKAGMITTVIGDGNPASSGEGGPAKTFPIDTPRGLACDAIGNLFVTSSHVLRLLPADPTGVVDGTGRVQTVYGLPPRDTFPASAATCLTGVVTVDASTVQVVDACTGLLVQLERKPVI